MSGRAAGTEREEKRNRVLRRADWRFLLPTPSPGRSICFADGLLAEATRAVSEEMVRTGASGQVDCNLAVAVDPDDYLLRLAWQSLEPGGSLYSEWYSPWAGSWPAVRKKLERAGFVDPRAYWVWPRPDAGPVGFWLPLGSPAALAHLLASRSQENTGMQRLVRGLSWRGWQAAERSGWVRPLCVVAARPHESGQADASGRREAQGGPARLLLTGGTRSINKAVAIDLLGGEPRAAVKMTRVPEAVAGLEREKRVLEGLAPVEGVPRVLFSQRYRDGMSLGETVVAGQPVYTQLGVAGLSEIARQATDWLIRLASANGTPRVSDEWKRDLERRLAEFAAFFGPLLGVEKLERIRAAVEQLGPLPIVPEQRDFSPWNVLMTDGGLGVVDWESAELDGLPACDLIYFLTFLGFFKERVMNTGREPETYRLIRDPSTAVGRVVESNLARYGEALGLSHNQIPALRLVTWVLHSRSEYARMCADLGAPPGMHALRQSVFLGLIEQELECAERPLGARA